MFNPLHKHVFDDSVPKMIDLSVNIHKAIYKQADKTSKYKAHIQYSLETTQKLDFISLQLVKLYTTTRKYNSENTVTTELEVQKKKTKIQVENKLSFENNLSLEVKQELQAIAKDSDTLELFILI